MRKLIDSFSFPDSRIKDAFAIIIIAGTVSTAYFSLTFLSCSMQWDMTDYFLPVRNLIGYCLQHQVAPVWNPYINFGYPLAADPQSGAWYPIVWILGYLFGYNASTMNAEFIIHVVIAGTGFYFFSAALGLSRRVSLLLACTYPLCGFFISNAQHLSWIIGAAWLPVFGASLIRCYQTGSPRFALLTSIVLFMMITGSYPAILIITFYIAVVYFVIVLIKYLVKKDLNKVSHIVKSSLIILLLTLLAAGYPLFLYMQSSSYVKAEQGVSLTYTLLEPFPVKAWLSFLNPVASLAHSVYQGTDISMANAYFGIGLLLVIGMIFFYRLKKADYFVLLVSVFFLLISAGSAFPIRTWLYNIVPGMNLFAFPALFRLFAITGFLIFSGKVLERLFSGTVSKKKWLFLIGFGGLLTQLYLYVKLHSSNLGLAKHHLFTGYSNQTILGIDLIVQCVFIILFIIALSKTSSGNKNFIFLCSVQLIFMIISIQPNMLITVGVAIKTKVINQEIASFRNGFLPDTNEIINSVSHTDSIFSPVVFNANIFRRKIAFDGYNPFELENSKRLGRSRICYKLANHRIIYFTSQIRDAKGYNFPRDSAKIPYGSLLLEDSDYRKIASRNDTNHIPYSPTIVTFKPDYIVTQTNNKYAGFLCLMQNSYPGWMCTIDKKLTPILKANMAMQAVYIPAGKHTVVFSFTPTAWKSGSIFTCGGFILMLLIYLSIEFNILRKRDLF